MQMFSCGRVGLTMTWEYKTHTQMDFDEGDASLRALGEQGWELVAVTLETDNSFRCFYFKRELKLTGIDNFRAWLRGPR